MLIDNAHFMRQEKYCPIDLSHIRKELIRFGDIMRKHKHIDIDIITKTKINIDGQTEVSKIIDYEDSSDVVNSLQNATLYYISAKNYLRNLLKPEKNYYIEKESKGQNSHFNWMMDNLGRIDRKLDEMQDDVTEKSAVNAQLAISKIKKYAVFLQESMENMVYNPVINAIESYRKKEQELTRANQRLIDLERQSDVTDKELFIYLLFLEVYHASTSTGSIMRDEIIKQGSKGSTNTLPSNPSSTLSQNPSGTQQVPNFSEEANIDFTEEVELAPTEDNI